MTERITGYPQQPPFSMMQHMPAVLAPLAQHHDTSRNVVLPAILCEHYYDELSAYYQQEEDIISFSIVNGQSQMIRKNNRHKPPIPVDKLKKLITSPAQWSACSTRVRTTLINENRLGDAVSYDNFIANLLKLLHKFSEAFGDFLVMERKQRLIMNTRAQTVDPQTGTVATSWIMDNGYVDYQAVVEFVTQATVAKATPRSPAPNPNPRLRNPPPPPSSTPPLEHMGITADRNLDCLRFFRTGICTQRTGQPPCRFASTHKCKICGSPRHGTMQHTEQNAGEQ